MGVRECTHALSMSACMYVCASVCMHAYVICIVSMKSKCMCIHVYLCVCICTDAYVFVHCEAVYVI